ncbi:sulfotransferase domain-containing protein [bacterium]|nr:sulfotransferase domain-containing protein [bacterium]
MPKTVKEKIRSYLTRWPERALPIPDIWIRDLTAKKRLLPSFIIIGAQRCGTTSLYDYLSHHPQIIPSPVKELFYFDDYFTRPIEWYKSFFPTKKQKEKLEREISAKVITGEASPSYFFHPYAARRIKETLPYVRLILVLRDPIERAYSHYNHIKRLNREPLSFEEAIEKEQERITPDIEKLAKDEFYKADQRRDYSYLTRGYYALQLKEWYKHFPKEQLLVVQSEEFYKETPKVYNEIVAYLGLNSYTLPTFEAKNALKYAKMAPETKEKLKAYFAPKNEELYELLGKRFDWQ